MGKWNPKYILGGFLVVVGLATFQNCGQSYNANGDPYESDPPVGIEPPAPGDGNIPIPDTPMGADRICNSSEGRIVLLTTGIINGVSSVRLKTAKEAATYPWTSADGTLIVNQPLGEYIVGTITLEKGSATVRLKFSGAFLDETLKCH